MTREAHKSKADRKHASAAASARGKSGGGYEDTAFGRRRISKLPRALASLAWLVGVPLRFIYRRVVRRGDSGA